MMNRTSSSSCQCSRVNLASIVSRLGVSGPHVDHVGRLIAAACLERLDLLRVGRQHRIGGGIGVDRLVGRPLFVVDAVCRKEGRDRRGVAEHGVFGRDSNECHGVTSVGPADGFEQELDDLDVAHGLSQ